MESCSAVEPTPSARFRGWIPIVVLPALVIATFPGSWPRWGMMWTLAVAIYAGCKWLTWRRTCEPGIPLWRSAAYLLAWPGMDAGAFLVQPLQPGNRYGLWREWLWGVAAVAAGAFVLCCVARHVPSHATYAVGWIGMVGIVMILHFGLFLLLSCTWRTLGVDAQPLMDSPLLATSIGEFWGRRWNRAFRDLTSRFLFRPLLRPLGTRGGLLIGFIASGLIHELVISVPAQGGYGGPTLFFAIQGLAILLSRSGIGATLNLRSGINGWLFAAVTLIGPAWLLFHRPFVNEVVVPFMVVLGAV